MSKSNLPCLLLLPATPTSLSPASLKAAYHPSITATLTKLASSKLSKPIVLEITVPFPGKYSLETPRSQLFEPVQKLLAGLYSLICIICAQNSIELEGAEGIDARVIILVHDTPGQSLGSGVIPPSSASGPIIDLEIFALTRRNWNHIFSVDGEHGQDSLYRYLSIANSTSPPVQGQVHQVQGGISFASTLISETTARIHSSLVHTTVAVGGTFDHLHAGHKLLLTATALLLQPSTKSLKTPRRLIIGITGDELLKNKKYAAYLKSWKQREEDVVDFLLTILSFNRTQEEDVETISFDEPVVNGRALHTRLKQADIIIECVEIQDPFGPTITDEAVSALVVSGETRSGGAAVNKKRKEKGWESLEVFEVDVLDAEDEKQNATETEEFASKISSTAIRKRKAEGTYAYGPSL